MHSFFKKNKFKRKESQLGLRSHGDFGSGNQNTLNVAVKPTTESEGDLDGRLLGLLETQRSEIYELKSELKRKEWDLKDALRQVERPTIERATHNGEPQHENDQVNLIKSQLQVYERSFKDLNMQLKHMRSKVAESEKELSELHNQLEAACDNFEQQRDAYEVKMRNVKEEKDLRLRQCVDDMAELRKYYEAQILERKEIIESQRRQSDAIMTQLRCTHETEKRYVTARAESQKQKLQQDIEAQRQQVGAKERRIHELDEQLQAQTEALEQTRLALNRTRNELTNEKRKARVATEENATKSQQLEYVQQQCALLLQKSHSSTPLGGKLKHRLSRMTPPDPKTT